MCESVCDCVCVCLCVCMGVYVCRGEVKCVCVCVEGGAAGLLRGVFVFVVSEEPT